MLTTAEAHLDRISEQLSVLPPEHSTECSALVNVARKFCLKASSSLQAKVLPTSLARCVKKAVRTVDDAALAVDQEHTRLDELQRLRLQSEQVEHTREVMAEEHHSKQRAAQRQRTQQLLDQLQAAEAKLDQLTEFVDFERQIQEVRKLVQNVKSFTELRGICAAEAVVRALVAARALWMCSFCIYSVLAGRLSNQPSEAAGVGNSQSGDQHITCASHNNTVLTRNTVLFSGTK